MAQYPAAPTNIQPHLKNRFVGADRPYKSGICSHPSLGAADKTRPYLGIPAAPKNPCYISEQVSQRESRLWCLTILPVNFLV